MRTLALLSALVASFGSGVAAQEPIHPTEGQGLCAKILNSGECARVIETSQIQVSHASVRRDSVRLYLHLATGKIISVVDDSTADFSYLGISSALGYYVLWVQYDEGYAIRLVNMRTGWGVRVAELPTVSPDRRHFVTATQYMERYNPERLVVWRVEGDTLRREWGLVPDTWVPDEVRWVSDHSFEFAHMQLGINSAFRAAIDTAEIDSTGQWNTRLGP